MPIKSRGKVDTTDWVVVIFPDNKNKTYYDVRLIKTRDRALETYGNASLGQSIYLTALEMEKRLTAYHLREHLTKLITQFSYPQNRYRQSVISLSTTTVDLSLDNIQTLLKDGDREALAKGLWNICHLIGDPIYGSPSGPEVSDKYRVRLDILTGPDYREILDDMPKQARILLEGLIENAEEVLTEDELHKVVKGLFYSGRLKTKQDPLLIWKFYAPQFGDKGLVYYPGKRHKLEDHEAHMAGI